MGSKTPPSTTPSQDAPFEDEAFGLSMSSETPAGSRTLRRVAAALQVPPSALYNPSNAVSPNRGSDSNSLHHTDLDQERMALLRAYASISDPEERRRILTLVQKAAEQT